MTGLPPQTAAIIAAVLSHYVGVLLFIAPAALPG